MEDGSLREGRASIKKRVPVKKKFEFSVDSMSPSRERSNERNKLSERIKGRVGEKSFREDNKATHPVVGRGLEKKSDLKVE